MNRDQMIEVMARAIYEGRNGRGCYAWHRHTNEHKRPYLGDATAALSALEAAGLSIVTVKIKQPNLSDAQAHIENLLDKATAVLAGASSETLTELSYAVNAFDRSAMISATDV